MDVFARLRLVPVDFSDTAPALLLEGSWTRQTPERQSLDEAIASPEFEHLDLEAQRLAERIAEAAAPADSAAPNFADLNILRLRYAAVKWLRVATYFREFRAAPSAAIRFHLAAEGDEEYAALGQALAVRLGLSIEVRRTPRPTLETLVPKRPTAARWSAARRLLARRLADRPVSRCDATESSRPSVLFVGNPRLLDGVCDEVLTRGAKVAWLYDEFPLRAWWKRRKQNVAWLTCRRTFDRSSPQRLLRADVDYNGVILTNAIEAWYRAEREHRGDSSARQWSNIAGHFASRRFTHVVLDEDATSLARAAVEQATRRGIPSWVVQHGVCGVRFGFVPLKTTGFLAWDDGARRQMEAWGESPAKIAVTGSPYHDAFLSKLREAVDSAARPDPARKRILLATIPPPRDERPDSVAFHLTSATYGEMLEAACAACAELPAAELVVKLHPRLSAGDPHLERALQKHPGLSVRIVSGGTLGDALAGAACLLSCASTAGIDAAAAGVPAVQLLPRGSGDVIPAAWYGLVGSARSLDELRPLLSKALAEKRRSPAAGDGAAARRIVDRLFASTG